MLVAYIAEPSFRIGRQVALLGEDKPSFVATDANAPRRRFRYSLLITLHKHKNVKFPSKNVKFSVKVSTFSVFGVNDFSTGNGQFTAFRPPNSPPLQVKIEIKTTEY